MIDKQLREKVDSSVSRNKEAGRKTGELKGRVLAQPDNNNVSNCFRDNKKEMAPKAFEMAAKRVRAGYVWVGQSASTLTHATATPRTQISSISSIESNGNENGGLVSEPSDSSDLLVLNAAVDACQKQEQSVLSNSSDFEIFVHATQEAELNNYRAVKMIDSNSSFSSDSSLPAPRPRVGQ